jgi:glycosyltransferase involved in cell wall biosynthesis
MRVWIENPFDNLPLEGFRPQRYWLMAEAFAKAGHEVVLWTADFNHTTKAVRAIDGKPSSFSLRLVHEPPYGGNVSLRRMYSHWRYALEWERQAMAEASNNGRPDVIIASTPPLYTGAVARRLAARFGAKLVLDVMDAWPETFERIVPRWMLAPLRRLARANYLGAGAITVVADRYVDLVRSYGFQGEIRRFYHGIDMADAPSGPKGEGGALRLAYAGNLGRTYDLATVVRALVELPDATLDIAGKGDGEGPLRALAKRLDLDSRVRFHGYLGESDLAAMFARCNVGVVPMADSSCVGVPYKFCDYAKAGLAIVSSLGGESARLLARYGAGTTYRASDSASLACALRSIDGSKAGLNALKMACSELDAAAIYDSYVHFAA